MIILKLQTFIYFLQCLLERTIFHLPNYLGKLQALSFSTPSDTSGLFPCLLNKEDFVSGCPFISKYFRS